MNVRLLEPAAAELDEAIAYYNAQVTGLGDAFLLEALRAIDLIKRHPDAWHPLGGNIRRCRLSRFPYAVVYTCELDELLIIAVAHQHRRPEYWRDRLKRAT